MEHLRKLVNHFKDQGAPRASEELFTHLETVCLPHALRILKKDNTLFTEIELFPGLRVNWSGSDEEWSLLHMALLHSVLRGDPKEKFGTLLETFKSMLPGGNAQASEIENILNNEETKNSLQEMLELLMTTRLASLVGEIAQSIDYADLGLDLEHPETLLDMFRNPTENPVLQELSSRAQAILEDRIRTGKLNQQELVREIEMLRAKFQSAFGRYLNEMVVGDAGGGTTGNTSAQILSNSPEARRARMLARLQKKQKLRK